MRQLCGGCSILRRCSRRTVRHDETCNYLDIFPCENARHGRRLDFFFHACAACVANSTCTLPMWRKPNYSNPSLARWECRDAELFSNGAKRSLALTMSLTSLRRLRSHLWNLHQSWNAWTAARSKDRYPRWRIYTCWKKKTPKNLTN